MKPVMNLSLSVSGYAPQGVRIGKRPKLFESGGYIATGRTRMGIDPTRIVLVAKFRAHRSLANDRLGVRSEMDRLGVRLEMDRDVAVELLRTLQNTLNDGELT